MATRAFVIDSGGVARQVQRLPVVDAGGVTREIQRAFVIDAGGVARLVFLAAFFYVDDTLIFDQTVGLGFSSSETQYQSDGDIFAITTTGGLEARGWWVEPTSLAPGAYTIRASQVSGSGTPTGAALNTDLPLTSSRTWGVVSSGAYEEIVLEITIKDGGGNTVAQDTVTLIAEAL